MQFLSDFTSVRLVKAQARSVSAVRWQRECEPPRTRGAVWMAARSLETMETRAATIARHKKHTPGYEHGHRRMQCRKKQVLSVFQNLRMGRKKNETDLQGDSAKEGVVGKKRELFIR